MTPTFLRVFAVPLSLLLLAASPTHAQEQAPEGGVAGQSATLKQLGASYTLNLRGIEGSDSVNFDVRTDRVVTGAKLNLEYSYSPALIPDMSQLNVLINDQVAASIPLPKEAAGAPQKQVVEIPPYLITDFNRLTLQLIGHYTMQCEDPQHSSLWAKVSNASQLDLQLTPLQLPNDLALLPTPFFDRRDARVLELPFVFADTPGTSDLEAAGAVASWFGGLASYRGARFPVLLGQLPAQGNAIVLISGQQAPAGLGAQASNKPTLRIVTNPNDPNGKLLLIAGADAQQLKQAALALVSGSQVMKGEQASINGVTQLRPRKPYDAPNWLPSDRPVKLGELLEAKRLSVSGYDPGTISLPMRLPPDLFTWREKGVPLNLKYRYTPQPVSTNSSLLVSISGRFIKSLPLPSQEALKGDQSLIARLKQDESLLREAQITVPLASFPLQSALQLRFMYDYIKQGECRDIIIDNMRGAIEPDSTLDLSDYRHFIAMPNLGVFRDSGFPFTRLADLSETAVVMPDGYGAEEVSALLDVLGRFGDSTGLPATGVRVVAAGDDAALRGKDLLVIASGANQPLLQRWESHLPVSLSGNSQFELSDLVYRVRDWVSGDDRVDQRPSRSSLALETGAVSNYLTGFESPLDSGRSVVVLAAGSPQGLAEVTTALGATLEDQGSIQGSLAVVNGTRVTSLVAEEQYYIGDLGWVRYLQWWMSRHLGGTVLLTAAGVALASLLLFLSLRARARDRLKD
ncbi:cellulose biosynthesis cyclic di-GMP-binding regulatory protein BcsB [Pseudomonas entomophila]|uniref:cellulose biosynthesis cyclic di-GMP-binding regulatory protein BcsB n=1 Tax=Pseudomonas entomophila TaxID=312306 RepID=UPI0023D7BD02|nr:cellulose biosynthesis cyclic di-GMP-binding regulatory protein BcsB [Pseudomonas entomophila]MDF0734248.1 cellulose biosynthesis cyclic di-GMP-binding regulatory protein BcsB [Pseudomonas entomophila]